MTRNGIIAAILDSIVPKVTTKVLTDAEVAARNRERIATCPAGCMCPSCEARR